MMCGKEDTNSMSGKEETNVEIKPIEIKPSVASEVFNWRLIRKLDSNIPHILNGIHSE